MSKCPKCNAIIANVNLEDMPIHVDYQHAWEGIVFSCPRCLTILGIQIDPVALKDDLRNEILNALREKKP